MLNPFQYGGIVDGVAFCNRRKELADLTAACENSEKLFVYSERRLGKTSLVRRVLRQLPKANYSAAYVDLWTTDGERSFVQATARAIRSRPLYRAAGHYPLGPITTAHWLPFIARKFREGEKTISDDAIIRVCDLTQGHPFYTQHLCHAIWELCEPGKSVTEHLIEAAVRIVLERENHAFVTLWESLAPNQKRFLKGLAYEPAHVKPFAGDFVRRHELGSASNAQRAAESLMSRDFIDRDNGSFLISDRFFRLWIAQKQVT